MALTKVSTGLLSTELSSVDLSIDAGTLYIDSTQNFVGISNTSPTTQLDVTGNLKVSGTSQVGALTFTSLTNTTNDITEGANNKYFTDDRVAAIIPAGSLAGTIGNVKMQYRPDGNYDAAAGSAVAGSFYFDALNSRLKVHTGSEFIDAIPFTAGGGGGGSTADANATFVNYQYTVTGSPTNTISGADTQELPAGDYIIGKSYEISSPGTTDFTTFGSVDNVSGTQFVATGSGLVTAGDFVIGDEYTIVYEGDSGTETNFVLVGATDSNPGTTFTATNNGSGTGTATQGSGTAHSVLGYSTTSASDVVVYVNGIKQRESSVDGYQATSGTSVGFTYNLPVDSIVDIQVYELLTNDAYYTKLETYTQAETNSQISTALSVYDDQTASDTRYVNVTGDTMTGNLSFADNSKAIFGAGSDLQIHHSGTNSYIVDSGDGSLYIQGSSNILLGSTTQSNLIIADGGAVTARYAGDNKLATSASGISVTGTVTADGLDVTGTTDSTVRVEATSGNDASLFLTEVGAGNVGAQFVYDGGDNNLYLKVGNNSNTNRLSVSRDTGDLSLYEDTGTTPKFYWEASTERLGLGTTSPSQPLDVRAETVGGDTSIIVYNNDNSDTTTQSARIKLGPDSRGGALAGMQAYKSTADYTLNTGRDAGLKLYTMNNNAEVNAMTMTNVGTIGIGQDVPSSQLHINASGSSSIKFERINNIVGVELTAAASGGWGLYDYASASFDMYMKAGQVSIGGVTPTTTLDLTDSSDTAERAIRIENNSARLYVGVEGAAGNRFSGSAVGNGFIGTTTAHGLEIGTNNNVRMRIDTSGNVGIGTVPEAWGSGVLGVDFGTHGALVDGTNVILARNAYYDGGWKYKTTDHASSYWQGGGGEHYWQTAASGSADATLTWVESMRIDPSGNLLVGKSAADGGVNGGEIRSNGETYLTATSAQPLALNRKSTDGALLNFSKDGAPVGSIGTELSTTYIQGNSVSSGFLFGNSNIYPWDAGALNDAGVDLGEPTYRFKGLYLSGGVVLDENPTIVGTTVAARTIGSKTLDDYEEGTWTPVYDSVSGLTNVTGLSDIDARYTKVGNTVQAHFTYKLTNSGSETITAGDYFIITSASLPFAPHTYVTSGSIDQFIGDHVWYQSIGTNNIASGSVLWGTGGAYLHFGVVNGTPDTGTSAYGLVRLQYDIS